MFFDANIRDQICKHASINKLYDYRLISKSWNTTVELFLKTKILNMNSPTIIYRLLENHKCQFCSQIGVKSQSQPCVFCGKTNISIGQCIAIGHSAFTNTSFGNNVIIGHSNSL